MLHIVNLEEIESMLLRVPLLVDLQEQRDANLVEEVKHWLVDLETVLKNNSIPEAGNIAALRSLLISSERGLKPEGIEIRGSVTGRKIKEATAATVIQKAGSLVSDVICKDRERVAEAGRIGRQLVALGRAKGLIGELPGGRNHGEMLKVLWRALAADSEMQAGVVNVEALAGPNDALIILDRAITGDLTN